MSSPIEDHHTNNHHHHQNIHPSVKHVSSGLSLDDHNASSSLFSSISSETQLSHLLQQGDDGRNNKAAAISVDSTGKLVFPGYPNTYVDLAKFRKKMCRDHLAGQSCPFGDRCVFAHSDEERLAACRGTLDLQKIKEQIIQAQAQGNVGSNNNSKNTSSSNNTDHTTTPEETMIHTQQAARVQSFNSGQSLTAPPPPFGAQHQQPLQPTTTNADGNNNDNMNMNGNNMIPHNYSNNHHQHQRRHHQQQQQHTIDPKLMMVTPPGALVVSPEGFLLVAGLTSHSPGTFIDPARFKTKMCRHEYPPRNSCPFGARCVFAHTDQELQEALSGNLDIEKIKQRILEIQAATLSPHHAAATVQNAYNNHVTDAHNRLMEQQAIASKKGQGMHVPLPRGRAPPPRKEHSAADDSEGSFVYASASDHQQQGVEQQQLPSFMEMNNNTNTVRRHRSSLVSQLVGESSTISPLNSPKKKRFMWNPYARTESEVVIMSSS